MTKPCPDFHIERRFTGLVAGVDEVGRGPLAGPVTAAAVILDPERLDPELRRRINDSKCLTPRQRQTVAAWLQTDKGVIAMAVACASIPEIAALNILHASHLAMRRALARLKPQPQHALIDGPYVPPGLPMTATAVVGGDGLSLSIACASILAKVTRDRAMARLALRYPAYGWERNAGYGTQEHRTALRHYGATIHHRLSFSCFARLLAE